MLLRRATAGDARRLHEWRNHPTTRAMSCSTQAIAFADHCLWLERLLAQPGRHMWLGVIAGEAVGSVRLDPAGVPQTCIASIQIDPDRRGQGLGHKILNLACDRARKDLQVQRLVAHIRPGNPVSARLFAAAGFHRAGQTASAPVLDIWHRDWQ